ncbi:MAG: RodZ domain-containing protein [Pseudomonadota bacterium]
MRRDTSSRMIGWGQKEPNEDVVEPKGFDDYELRLGDVMRGERATMGKSLLDVQRELKIKAGYIAAIENADPTAFETQGFIAGFVRSYARYLGLDPDWAFEQFSEESGFTTAHGMSADALPVRQRREERLAARPASEALASPSVPINPNRESVFAAVEPRAIGSSLVLVALICGLGYGAWALLQEVQRVELAPVEQAPTVTADVSGFGAAPVTESGLAAGPVGSTGELAEVVPPTTDALERLYRPAALDVPVMVPRDAPIASLNPDAQGVFVARGGLPATAGPGGIAVTDGRAPEVSLLAVQPTWVRVQAPGQSVLFEQILEPGEEFAIPVTEETPLLRAGNAGALYFRVNGTLVGPAGPAASIVTDVQLASTDLSAAYQPADPLEDRALFELLDELGSPDVLPRPAAVIPPDLSERTVSLVAVQDSWVRVRDASGAVRFEGIVPPGQVETLPADMEAPTLRAGNSGSLYFQVGEFFFGPVGEGASTASNVEIAPEAIRATYPIVTAEELGLTR